MPRALCVAIAIVVCEAAMAMDYTVKGPVIYAEPGGKRLKMTLFLPKANGDQHRPGVVLIHGGAWLFGTRRQLQWYGRRFAENGYVAAAVSYRMMPRFPFPHCAHDCKAAVRWMRIHADDYGIDCDRIAVLGNSAGGHLAALLATTRSEDGLEGDENPGASSAVQAAVDLYGVADMSYYRRPRGYIRLLGFTAKYIDAFVGKGCEEGENPYDAASPANYTHRDACPVLFIHGKKDHFVPYAQSVVFCEQLRRLGVPTRLITVPYGHAFDFFHFKTRKYVFAEILEFLQIHLGAK